MNQALSGPVQSSAYDIVLEMTKTDDHGQVTKPGRITVLHNGVVVHHALEFTHRMSEAPLGMQDHNNPMRLRNIWVRQLPGYDSTAAPKTKPTP